jgi:hypothetical protein
MGEYWCGVCYEQIDPTAGEIHSLANGEDCHAACCPDCGDNQKEGA